ncbi:tektin-like protein 1 [Lethenteron reissneri]|uniref:tektin-like protein 1 n=1 Tax=Lethenteron reissneri TaxID=7753 RepID=UPI002AB79909|nr:tektin-like protein 1 [Lethenteron reissneri]
MVNTACSCEPIYLSRLSRRRGRHPNVWNSPSAGVDVGGSGVSAAGAGFWREQRPDQPPSWREQRPDQPPSWRPHRVARMPGPPPLAPAETTVSSPHSSIAPFPMAAKQRCDASPAAPRAAPSLSVTGAAIPGAVRRMVVTPSPSYEGVQNLALCRKRLLACISERSCVLDLIGHATPSRLSHTTPSAKWSPDPIGPLSPECARVLEEAAQGQKEVMAIRSEISHVIKKVAHLQSRARQRVTQGLGQKLVETNCLARALQVSAGHTRMAIHQAQRWHAAISTAQGYIEGPKRYGDIPLRKRLDRPMVKVYQRHPGTQLPEATGILQAGEGLSHSLAACKGDLEQLVSAQHMLAADLRDKVAATRVDAEAARFRRRCATFRY